MSRAKDVIHDGLYSIEMLRTTLKVSRRTVERAMANPRNKLFQPCAYTIPGRRARFNQIQVGEMQCLAREKRSLGSKYVMGCITSTGMTKKPREQSVSASRFLKKKLLKHNPDLLRSWQVAEKYLDLDAMLDI